MKFILSWHTLNFFIFNIFFFYKKPYLFFNSIPPNLNILTLSLNLLLLIQSNRRRPPFNINLILFPNSSLTSSAETGLIF